MVKMYAGCSETDTEKEVAKGETGSDEDDGESYAFDSDESEDVGAAKKTKKRKRTKSSKHIASTWISPPSLFCCILVKVC